MALMVGATAVTPATERRTESGGDSEARHQVLQLIGVQWVVMMWKFYRLVMLSYVQWCSYEMMGQTSAMVVSFLKMAISLLYVNWI